MLKEKKVDFRLTTILLLSIAASSWGNSAAADCQYSITNEWQSGFTAAITITNNNSSPINNWEISWEYTDGSVITNSWNANISGENPYTATPAGWNSRINPGHSIAIGFQGTHENGKAQIPAISGDVCSESNPTYSSSQSSIIQSSSAPYSNVSSSSSSISSSSISTSATPSSSTSNTENCSTQCLWYGTYYPVCTNQTSGWGWEGHSCIGENTCNSQQGDGGVVDCADNILSSSLSSSSSSSSSMPLSISSSSISSTSSTVSSSSSIQFSSSSANSSTEGTTIYALTGSILDTDDTAKMCTKRDMRQTADVSAAEYIQLTSGQNVSITQEGVYVISGSATNSTITVDADGEAKVQLVLDGISITNRDAPGVYVKSADKVFITTTQSSNRIEVSGTYVADGDTNLDAAIFSKDDITLNGIGSLDIISAQGNGVTSKDDLKVTGGNISISSALDGLEANDSIRICGGDLTINSGKDALHSENDDDDSLGYIYISAGSLEITAGDDGVRATSVTQIDGGTINVKNSVEGIEGTYIQINDGNISVYATDDGINATRKSSAYDVVIEVNGGNISVEVQGGDVDGFDANGNIYVNGGTISITCPTQGMSGPFDADGSAVLNGGTVTVNGEVVTELNEGGMGGRPGFWG